MHTNVRLNLWARTRRYALFLDQLPNPESFINICVKLFPDVIHKTENFLVDIDYKK